MTNAANEKTIAASLTVIREDLALRMTDGATPKDLRSSGNTVGVIDKWRTHARGLDAKSPAVNAADTALESTESGLQALAWNAKAAARDVLSACIDKLDEIIDEAEGDSQAVARLPEIEDSIRNLMQTASTSLLSVGQLLNEARDEFDKAKDFLAWAKESFGFQKAYCYRLMSVADNFTADDVLAGQSINVLHKLAGMPEEVRSEARAAVQEGEALTGAQVQRMAAPEPENSEQVESEPAPEDATDDAPRSVADSGEDTGAPWDAGTGAEAPQGQAPALAPDPEPEPAPAAAEGQPDEVARLSKLVEELQAELAAARTERENKGKAKAQSPMLPQFKSACMYARLGLSAEQAQDAAEVRKAFRQLVKAGYNSQHEAHSLLIEAKEALDGSASKAA